MAGLQCCASTLTWKEKGSALTSWFAWYKYSSSYQDEVTDFEKREVGSTTGFCLVLEQNSSLEN